MKLYFSPRTRATRARWLLEELGVSYELVRLDLSKQESRTPAYLAQNPLGEVPTLVDGDLTLFDSAAICLYLADRFPQGQLAPAPGSAERGPYYQWLLFAERTLEPVVLEFHRHAQLPEEQRTGAHDALDSHRPRLEELLAMVDAALEGREHLIGEPFTAAG